ncbi:hypothetical protein BUALT_Bualt07G0158800 [Buddleja alternifolia]|uniref:Beta-fructofuranosidase n=1 Tax=Buddleja alternifolia TaxID=168488 RepID=A0AAV6XC38_9LAMI|nr:hypothetical protein BUALT_Bualt07G0158800 [Buddleja alternifolia]
MGMGYSLSWLIICLLSIIGNIVFEIEANCDIIYKDHSICLPKDQPSKQPYRTAYHFQPPKNWMNGPMIYKGIYHLFYQYNPKGALWGYLVWAHSTSKDLVNWTPHPIAFYPDQEYDINGCWSGSTTILPGGKPVILYTGINSQNKEVQNLAYPKNLSDPYLIEWTKSPYNPLLAPNLENMINARSFRDPSTSWLGNDGEWRVIIGNEREQQGKALLYRSKDFVHWTEAKHPLHSSSGSGMWECLDFYPVSISTLDGVDTSVVESGVKYVLKVSLFDVAKDSYVLGRYIVEKDVFIPENESLETGSWLRYDYGKFYGSKTFFDSSTKRRILWAWINESTDATIDVKKGWSGIQAIPRTIWLDESGKQLVQWPVTEIEKLRTKQVIHPSTMLKGELTLEISGVTASQADVEISFEIPTLENAEEMNPNWTDAQTICSQKGASIRGGLGPFGLLILASEDLQEYTAVFFRVFKDKNRYVVLMCSDQSRSSVLLDYDKTTYGAFVDLDPLKEKLSLRSLIDHSVVESFGGEGKACITARVYPTLAIDEGAHLYAFNNGTENINISKLTAWSMKKAKINEET